MRQTLNFPPVIAVQSRPTASGQHPEKVYPGHIPKKFIQVTYALLIAVVKFPAF